MYEPNCDYVNDLVDLSFEDCTKLLWFIDGKYPLIVPANLITNEIVKLCRNRRYVLIGDYVTDELSGEYRVFQKLSDLTKSSEVFDELSTNFICKLLGNEVSLGYLINEDEKIQEIITTNDLLEMIDHPYTLNDEQEELPTPYVTRFLSINYFDMKYLTTVDDNTFIILSNAPKDETTIKNYLQKPNFYISHNDCSWEELKTICGCHKGMENYRYFRIKMGKLQLIERYGNVSDLDEYRIPNFCTKEDKFISLNYQHSVNLLTAEPGMGKSVLLKSLKNNLSSKLRTLIFSPNDISAICSFSSGGNQSQIEQFVVNLKYGYFGTFDKFILTFLMKKGQIAYLWDALDEISDTDFEIVTNLITYFAQKVSVQWITSRHHLKKSLENKFNLLSISIYPFDDNEQVSYIKDRLAPLCLTEKIEDTIVTIIKSNIAAAAISNILAIPLQIFMLTEIFLHYKEKYIDLADRKLFSLADLYHHFIAEKFNFHYKKESSLDCSNNNLQRILREYKENRIKNYQKAAIKMLFDSSFLQRQNLDCNDFIKKIQDQGDEIGFIRQVVGHMRPQFLHISYAEYFAASYFAENYKIVSGLEGIMFDERYTCLRFFFDNLLAQNSPPHVAVLYKNLETLKQFDQLEHSKDCGGRNLLHLASSWGDRYQLFEVKKSDNTYEIEFTSYFSEIKEIPKLDKELLEYLLQLCDVNEEDDVFKLDCISYADKCGCFWNMIVIEDNKRTGYLNSKDDRFRCNMLFYSSYFGYAGIIDCYNKVCNIKTRSGSSLLHLASEKGHYEIVYSLIENGANVNIEDVADETPLHSASQYGHHRIAELLIKSGANVNIAANLNVWTPLHLASWYGHDKIAEVLIKSGANLNVGDDSGDTPLHLVSRSKRYQLANPEENDDGGCCVTIQRLQSNGSYYEIAKLLIKSAAEVNVTNEYGDTPLHIAARDGCYEIVELLIKSAANVNCTNRNGYTALHFAIQKNHDNIADYLVKCGANVKSATIEKKLPKEHTENETEIGESLNNSRGIWQLLFRLPRNKSEE